MPRRPITNPQKREPWDRRPTEGPSNFGQFRCYLELDPEKRTYEAAWQKWKTENKPEGPDHAPGWWRNIARKHEWQDRADAYDIAQSRKIEDQLLRRRVRALLETADLGETLRKKAAQAAKMLTTEFQKAGEHEGKEVWIRESNLSPTEIARMAQVGVELEQLALGGPTARTEQSGKLEVTPGADISLDTAKQTISRKLEEMRTRYEDVQRRLTNMNEQSNEANGPRLLPPSREESAA